MKKLFVLIPMLLVALFIAWCDVPDTSTSDDKLNAQQETLMKQATDQLWMPAIKNFTEKRIMKSILELRYQENLTTYTYLFSMQWKLVFLCKSVGYWLPYSTEYTNPEKIVEYYNSQWWNVTVPQADPNWLFSSQSTSATRVMCQDTDWKPRPVYVESDITTSPFPLSIN